MSPSVARPLRLPCWWFGSAIRLDPAGRIRRPPAPARFASDRNREGLDRVERTSRTEGSKPTGEPPPEDGSELNAPIRQGRRGGTVTRWVALSCPGEASIPRPTRKTGLRPIERRPPPHPRRSRTTGSLPSNGSGVNLTRASGNFKRNSAGVRNRRELGQAGRPGQGPGGGIPFAALGSGGGLGRRVNARRGWDRGREGGNREGGGPPAVLLDAPGERPRSAIALRRGGIDAGRSG